MLRLKLNHVSKRAPRSATWPISQSLMQSKLNWTIPPPVESYVESAFSTRLMRSAVLNWGHLHRVMENQWAKRSPWCLLGAVKHTIIPREKRLLGFRELVDLMYWLIPQSHRQTDTKPTSNRQKSSNSGRNRFTVGFDSVLSVWCRFMFGQTNLSGRDLSNMFERSLPDKLSVVCRLYVGVVSVLLGSVRGRVGLNLATDGRWFVGLRSVMHRAYVGRPDTDPRPIQDRIKSDITPNCVESADTFPNQNRQMPDISRTQTECKPITICGLIPAYKSTPKIPENISSPKWRHKMTLLEVCHN